MMLHLNDMDIDTKDNGQHWVEKEIAGCEFGDQRIKKRFNVLIGQMYNNIGETIPLACQDWANTKAAYRFLSNQNVDEEKILRGHFHSTKERFSKVDGPIFILHDTTTFSYQRCDQGTIGGTYSIPTGKRDLYGNAKTYTQCGILMHGSLAITPSGVPLGLAAVKFWTRKKFIGRNGLSRRVNATRVDIEKKESYRWIENIKQSTELFGEAKRCVHIGDRESDIYEIFCLANELNTNFLVRSYVDRLANDGMSTINKEMRETAVKGIHRIEVINRHGAPSEAKLQIKYRRINVAPPVGKEKRYSACDLTIIHAEEIGKPAGREKISWKLITNLPVTSKKSAVEKIKWYAMRWKIETFHKVLKSACKAEDSKLRTAENLTNLIAIYCILSWRVFWMTMINRIGENLPPCTALTDLEINLLDELIIGKSQKSLSAYLLKIAKLGGYLARASDPPPGNIVMWRGVRRLIDIQLGFYLGQKIVGN
jgi:Transposase DNA-binding